MLGKAASGLSSELPQYDHGCPRVGVIAYASSTDAVDVVQDC